MEKKEEMIVRGILLVCVFFSIIFNLILMVEVADLDKRNQELLEYNKDLTKTNMELSEKYNYEKLQAEYYYNQLQN